MVNRVPGNMPGSFSRPEYIVPLYAVTVRLLCVEGTTRVFCWGCVCVCRVCSVRS